MDKNYEIILTRIDDITFAVSVKIFDETGAVMETSEVNVSCETETEAYNCVEQYHLPNMRRNSRYLKDVVFTWEIPAEQPTEVIADDTNNP